MKHTKIGTGDYLVLVHGALTDETMWLPHREHLQSDYEVVAITQRHFADAAEGGFGLNTHADDLASFLCDLAGEKPVFVVGWSYGADVVLNMLVRHSIDLAGALLYEPGFPGCLTEEEMDAWLADANAMFGKVFEHFSQGRLGLAVETMIDGSGNKPGYFLNQDPGVRDQQLAKANTLALQLNQQEQPEINRSTVADIRVPLTVGFGAETRAMFRLVSLKTAECAEAAVLVEVVGEGHMLPQENPAKFAEIIKNASAETGRQG